MCAQLDAMAIRTRFPPALSSHYYRNCQTLNCTRYTYPIHGTGVQHGLPGELPARAVRSPVHPPHRAGGGLHPAGALPIAQEEGQEAGLKRQTLGGVECVFAPWEWCVVDKAASNFCTATLLPHE